MDKFVSVGFIVLAAVVLRLRSAAPRAFSIFPKVLYTFESDITISVCVVKPRNGIFTVGVCAAIYAAP